MRSRMAAARCRCWRRSVYSSGNAAASARCTSAVARPSSYASSVKSAPEARVPRACVQPSSAPRRYGWRTARVASHGSEVRTQATGAGTRVQPCRARAPGTSRSGLTPGWTRRNTLRMYVSPYTTEELDCSASRSRGASPEGSSTLASRSKARVPAVPGVRSRSRSRAAERGSCKAS